jgi:small subunit ribosomal protein S20
MANIKSQIKRNNRSERERVENRQYTSQIKTYFRRLETAVTESNDEATATEHRKLVSLIDKAVKRGALHANTGARKKARAERMRNSAPQQRARRLTHLHESLVAEGAGHPAPFAFKGPTISPNARGEAAGARVDDLGSSHELSPPSVRT